MFKDLQTHAFYRPLWRRVAIVVSAVVWTIFELMGGNGLWITIAAGTAVYTAWSLLLTYPKSDAPDQGA
jgi:hypothetical protein